jgi:hypothetical protein
MAVGVGIPNRPRGGSDDLTKLLTLGGMGVGAFYGGVPGAAAGASIGGTLGGMTRPEQVQAPAAVESGASDALSRRMAKLSQSPNAQLRESIDSLKYIENPEQRAALAKPLLMAEYLSSKGNGGVV